MKTIYINKLLKSKSTVDIIGSELLKIAQNTPDKQLCPICGCMTDNRVKRSSIVKSLFFWLPLKRYFCEKCVKKFYVLKK